MAEYDEFFQRSDVTDALKQLAGACFAQIEQDEAEPKLPDAAEFLRERGIDPPAAATLSLKHTVHSDNVKPDGPICDENVRAIPTDCQWINGSMHCVWVCP